MYLDGDPYRSARADIFSAMVGDEQPAPMWRLLEINALFHLRAAIDKAADKAADETTRDFQRARGRLGIHRPVAIAPGIAYKLPSRFLCPECAARTLLEVDDWSTVSRTPTAGGFRVLCQEEEKAFWDAFASDEDIDADDEHRHWQSDWQPLQDEVARWMVRNVEVRSCA